MATTTIRTVGVTDFSETEGSIKPRSIERRLYRPGTSNTGVLFRGVLYGGSGYAQENLMVVQAMAQAGIPVRIEPVMEQQDSANLLSPEARTTLELAKIAPVELLSSIYLQSMPGLDFESKRYARRLVGRTMFETDRIPDGWTDRCNAMDEVWVPSSFNVETFCRAGVKEHKLRRMQEGEDTSLFNPLNRPFHIPGTRGFNFLSVFQWAQRKGPDLLLKAYVSEFREDEDVALILRTYGRSGPDSEVVPDLLYYIERELRVPLEKVPPIIVIPGFIPNEDLPRLYTSADCFVLPSRGEGWGRPYVEALCSEIPVIATRWSGQLDFLHDANSYLIDCEMVSTPADTDVEVFAGHRWAEPKIDHLRSLMRHVFTRREEAKEKARIGRQEMVEKFDRRVIMAKWVAEIQRLLS